MEMLEVVQGMGRDEIFQWMVRILWVTDLGVMDCMGKLLASPERLSQGVGE